MTYFCLAGFPFLSFAQDTGAGTDKERETERERDKDRQKDTESRAHSKLQACQHVPWPRMAGAIIGIIGCKYRTRSAMVQTVQKLWAHSNSDYYATNNLKQCCNTNKTVDQNKVEKLWAHNN